MKLITKKMRGLRCIPVACFVCILLLAGCDRRDSRPPAEQASPVPDYQGTIIAVGDSLTAGLGVAEAEAWPALLEKKLMENGHDWQVVNAGISGETSSGALARIPWILAQKPEIVILETGANDGLRGIPVPVIKENISRSVRMLKQNGVTVVLAGMQMVQNLGPDYTADFAALYPAIAEKEECIFIPFLLREVAGEPSLNQADTIHPNEKGHQTIARTVYPYAAEAIAAAQSAE
jgi:acyl-CoA thioesterase I